MGLGIAAKLSFTVLRPQDIPPAEYPRWAVLGRSNVGKSSLLNALVHPKKIFKTGSKPGVTVGLIGVHVQLAKPVESTLELVDVPGFGFARRSQVMQSQWGELIESLREDSEEKGLMWLWLADPEREPSDEEMNLISWLDASPFIFVFTKSDQVKNSARSMCEKKWAKIIERASEGPFWVSALKGTGFEQLQKSARSFVRTQYELRQKLLRD